MSSNFSTNFVIDEIVQKVEKLNFRKKSPKNPSRKRKTLDDDDQQMANNETQEAKRQKSGNILIQVYQWAEWRGGIRKRTEIGPISAKEAKKIQKTAVKNYFAHKEDEKFRENDKQEKIAKWGSTILDEQKRKNIFHSMKLVMDFPEIEKMLISKDGEDDNFGITFQRSILREGFFITSIAEGSPAAKVNLLPGTTFISMECFDKEGNSSEVFYIARDGDEIGLWQKAMNNADVLIFELVQQ